jgi:hypothetical protein
MKKATSEQKNMHEQLKGFSKSVEPKKLFSKYYFGGGD